VDMDTFSTLFFIGFVLFILFIPSLKQRAKRIEYDKKAQTMAALGYRYDWDKYNKIQNDVREDRNKNPEKYPNLHEYGKEINRRCEAEKLLNRSDLERRNV
jgi:hypothetical protein